MQMHTLKRSAHINVFLISLCVKITYLYLLNLLSLLVSFCIICVNLFLSDKHAVFT